MPVGLDCSSPTSFVLQHAGFNLPRSSAPAAASRRSRGRHSNLQTRPAGAVCTPADPLQADATILKDPVPDQPQNLDGDQILNQLREADETTLRFSPWGLGGRLEPSSSAAYLAEMMSHATLVEAVPEDVRLSFERVRTVFMHGLLDYDLFSAAYSLGHLVLEGALRTRFITYYKDGIPILRDGSEEVLAVSSFAQYHRVLRSARKRRQKLQLGGDKPEPLPQGYPDLYAWARHRGLLIGQRNIGVFGSIVKLRNYVAHPEGHMVDMPPNVFRFLRDLTEIVNRLWGHNNEGGRLFPGPIARWARAAALAPDGRASLTFSSLAQVRSETDRADWTYGVFLAAAEEDLITIGAQTPGGLGFTYVSGFQITAYPAELLWGPGRWDELVASLGQFSEHSPVDQVSFLDRNFYIRVTPHGGIELPRDRRDVLATEFDDDSATWHVLRADFPMDAFVLIRDREHAPDPELTRRAVITDLSGDRAARAHAAADPPDPAEGQDR